MANQTFDTYRIGFPNPGHWRVRFNSDWSGYDPGFGNHASKDVIAKQGEKDGMPCKGQISIGPYSVIILSLEK
jgi:1,4-alpha-glucan branching enzyme